jgi:hypothetical protein
LLVEGILTSKLKFTKLTVIDVSFDDDSKFEILVTLINAMEPTLNSVEFASCAWISSSYLVRVLQKLSMTEGNVKVFEAIVETLSKCSWLTSISFRQVSLLDSRMETLCKFLCAHPNISQINFG